MYFKTQNREEIRNSSLEELLKTVKNDPYKIPEMIPDKSQGLAGYSLGETNEKYHEAGYDAFITGLCFIALSNRYATKVGLGNAYPANHMLSTSCN
jgi:poly(A)-specific ribonuclease